jgi:hypothetical protein
MIDDGRAPYRCAPAIAWVKDFGQTILVDQETGESWILSGAEATIWDLLTLGYPADRIAGFLSLLSAQSPREAAGVLASVVGAWAQAGILRTEG